MNAETKRHIDSARQILVGVVPNPTSQIDQITNALIYKFMDDMDQAAIKQGDKASFFIEDLEKYAWTRLMDSRMGNQERMNLYSEALIKFAQAKQLVPLFRDVFKSAFLPYRSPETLGLFLKEIDYFDYSHPEELGNAYEYLLSIMSSQGDAGQFRTPRHIIDFMVDVVNPTKGDKVLDPACGTGGFLVSSYNHILEQHDGQGEQGEKEKPLTPDERRKLMANLEGYDIDPTMVRIAQVNMYLHQFKSPKIFQYDGLSNEERWNDKFDVILANPPFMSPKGGIKPHSKFSIQSSRSEVLFVDYIMNHLKPGGRAGIIVPEGVIFQSGSAHKELRKNLVNDGLYAVVSLPSGVFAPYSGVKTSILLFNTAFTKTNTEILFVKVEQDGYDLGATKRPISKNDLPMALEILNKWNAGEKVENKLAVYVEKSKIAETGDYNLSGDRYRVATDYTNAKWPMVELGKMIEFEQKSKRKSGDGQKKGLYKFFVSSQNQNKFIGEADYIKENLILGTGGNASVHLGQNFSTSADTFVFHSSDGQLSNPFLYHLLLNNKELLERGFRGQGIKHLSKEYLLKIKIPLPPLEIQEQIVAELKGYAGIIAGARQIVKNWKPKIDIDPEWEKVKLGDDKVLQIVDGDRGVNYPSKEEFKVQDFCLFLNTSNVRKGAFDFSKCDFITQEKDNALRKGKLIREDVVLTTRGTLGNTAYFSSNVPYENIRINSGMVILRSNLDKVYPNFLLLFLNSLEFELQVSNFMSGSAQPQLPIRVLNEIEIPIPPLSMQKKIVEKIEAERTLVESAKRLIEVYEKKTKEVIAKLWEE
jgi:type I restriction enzyme M protein